MREVDLPSGAKLQINVSPFATSKALYQAILSELSNISFSSTLEVGSLLKNIFCIGFSSQKIESCLLECFKKCLYKQHGTADFLRIDNQTFEPEETRSDYLKVCVEVARDNINPFMKSLYAEYLEASKTIGSSQK